MSECSESGADSSQTGVDWARSRLYIVLFYRSHPGWFNASHSTQHVVFALVAHDLNWRAILALCTQVEFTRRVVIVISETLSNTESDQSRMPAWMRTNLKSVAPNLHGRSHSPLVSGWFIHFAWVECNMVYTIIATTYQPITIGQYNWGCYIAETQKSAVSFLYQPIRVQITMVWTVFINHVIVIKHQTDDNSLAPLVTKF